jgi:cytochrome bd ubiquinol oxidase subunit II
MSGNSMLIFWLSILALSILLFGLLYQFDRGIGILLGFTRREEDSRRATTGTVGSIGDGNEKWLIVAGIVACGAFPVVYATLLSALYLPFLLMLAGLILRGVAFGRRNKPQKVPWLRNAAIFASLVVALMQGLIVGVLVEALIVSRSKYSGDEFSWWNVFAALCGMGGLCVGYALLGACWLARKCEGDDQTAAYRLIPALSLGSLLALVFAFVYSMAANLSLLTH